MGQMGHGGDVAQANVGDVKASDVSEREDQYMLIGHAN